MLGRSIKKLPNDIEALYSEMRKASADEDDGEEAESDETPRTIK